MAKCKHQYEDVLVHSLHPFWGDEYYLSKQCQMCGKVCKGSLPMDGSRFLEPDEIFRQFGKLKIINEENE